MMKNGLTTVQKRLILILGGLLILKGSMTGAVLIFAGCLLISILVGGFSVMRLLQEKETNRMWTNRVQAMEPVESEFAALLEEVVNRKMLDVFDLYCDNKNNHFHALLKSMEAQCPKSFKIQSITSDEEKVTINESVPINFYRCLPCRFSLKKLMEFPV